METDRILLTQGWRFALTDDDHAVSPEYDDGAFQAVTLPHDWQIAQARVPDAPGGAAQGFFPREQRGVYRLRLHAPESWRGRRVRVLFDGVQRFSTVYCNGEPVGGRPYGYVPFLCELTDRLLLGGDNVLAVSVDNRQTADSGRFGGGDRWYSGAGVYRNVWLLVDAPTHIAHGGVRVTAVPVMRGPSGDVPDVAGIQCDQANVDLSVEVEGDCAGMSLRAAICDADGALIWEERRAAQPRTRFALTLAHPALWSPQSPTLYRARLTLEESGDTHGVAFGVRSAEFDSEDGFLLNGVPTKLMGVNLHHDGGALGAAVPIEVWRRRLTALKALGANTVRASHHPMAEEFYALCDELGLLVVDELYDKWSESGMYYDRFYDEWHARDLEAMVRRDWNHPCVILWSVGNEVNHQYSELFYQCLRTLCDQVRALDPTRAVSAVLIGFVLKDYNDITPMGRKLDAVMRYAEIVDVFMGNYMEHFYEKLRERGMRKPIIGSEVRNYYRLDSKALNSVQLSPESPFAIVREHPWVCGALVWAGIDYLGESSFWPLRGWTGNLLDSTADWKLRAWYCAAQWRDDPVLKLCVYDTAEPWDGARGAWGFPQVRAHWRYDCFEKMLHVAVMTNCDTVKLYQNSQTARVGYLRDFPDGMIHFELPYIPGLLRAEGYRGGLLVKEDCLYSDHEAAALRVVTDRTSLPADGQSVAMIDLLLEDGHGQRYMLEDRRVRVRAEGGTVRLLLDNGDARSTRPFATAEGCLCHGHLLVLAQAGTIAGQTVITLEVEGFDARTVRIDVGEE